MLSPLDDEGCEDGCEGLGGLVYEAEVEGDLVVDLGHGERVALRGARPASVLFRRRESSRTVAQATRASAGRP